MITTAIINLGYLLLSFIISIFPSGSGFPASVHTSASILGTYLQMINAFLPIDTLATVVGLYIVFELILFAFRSFKWFISHIPFIGGRG